MISGWESSSRRFPSLRDEKDFRLADHKKESGGIAGGGLRSREPETLLPPSPSFPVTQLRLQLACFHPLLLCRLSFDNSDGKWMPKEGMGGTGPNAISGWLVCWRHASTNE